MRQLSVRALNKSLPDYVWNLSIRQSRILLNSLIEGDGSRLSGSIGFEIYHTSSVNLANDITRLALHCGWSGNVKKNRGRCVGDSYNITKNGISLNSGILNADCLSISINKKQNEPQINHGHINDQCNIEHYVHYRGKVFCLEIPDTHKHIYYYRENMLLPPCWTGNSNRSGQKGLEYTHALKSGIDKNILLVYMQ
jgi:hypothetical protein